MKLFPLFMTILITGVLAMLGGCKDDTTDTGPIDIVFPDSNISYGREIQPLFDRGCAFSGCHGEETFEFRGFSLDSYQHLTARTDMVRRCFPNETCDPEQSTLVRRIEGLDGRERMPLGRTPLTANQINGIKQWIREGASNN